MAKIYDITAVGTRAVTIGSGKVQLITLNLFPECLIGTIMVSQVPEVETGGTPVAFKVDLLKSTVGLDPDTDIDLADLPYNYRLFTVMPQIEAAAGALGSVFTAIAGSDGFLFRNIDGSQTVPIRKAYLLVQPIAAAGATKWEYSVVASSSLGS